MTIRKLLAVLLGGLMLSVSFAPIASAQNNGVVSQAENPADFLYWEDGILVMTGSAQDVCSGDAPPTLPGQRITPKNGSMQWQIRGTTPVTVYEIPDFTPIEIDLVIGWLLENCEAIPYASGEAELRGRFRFDTKGVLHVRNGLNGSLATSDGERVRVHTFARVEIDAATGGLIALHRLDAVVH